jgi:hypothetical protein
MPSADTTTAGRWKRGELPIGSPKSIRTTSPARMSHPGRRGTNDGSILRGDWPLGVLDRHLAQALVADQATQHLRGVRALGPSSVRM